MVALLMRSRRRASIYEGRESRVVGAVPLNPCTMLTLCPQNT